MLTAVLIAGGLLLAGSVVLRITNVKRNDELRRYGVTPEIREAARHVEPDPGAPEPEELA